MNTVVFALKVLNICWTLLKPRVSPFLCFCLDLNPYAWIEKIGIIEVFPKELRHWMFFDFTSKWFLSWMLLAHLMKLISRCLCEIFLISSISFYYERAKVPTMHWLIWFLDSVKPLAIDLVLMLSQTIGYHFWPDILELPPFLSQISSPFPPK